MPWEMVFEALLRCGGNLVIPGTDKEHETRPGGVTSGQQKKSGFSCMN